MEYALQAYGLVIYNIESRVFIADMHIEANWNLTWRSMKTNKNTQWCKGALYMKVKWT